MANSKAIIAKFSSIHNAIIVQCFHNLLIMLRYITIGEYSLQ